jgi:hypothetical protein
VCEDGAGEEKCWATRGWLAKEILDRFAKVRDGFNFIESATGYEAE